MREFRVTSLGGAQLSILTLLVAMITVLSVRHEEKHYTVVILQTFVFGQAFQFSGHNLDRKISCVVAKTRNDKVKKIK